MTDPDAKDRLYDRAQAAFEARLDSDFGNAYLDSLLASAVADAIQSARSAGAVGADELGAILTLAELDDGEHLVTELLAAESFEELRDSLLAELSVKDQDDLVALVGEAEELAGFSSDDFAVMTAGDMTTWIVRRNDRFALMDTGDDASRPYELRDARTEASDPDLRQTRLGLAASLSGLGPGVWIANADDIDDELRDLTMNSGYWHEWWQQMVARAGDIDYLVAHHLRVFTATTRLDEPAARGRLRALLDGRPTANDAERRAVWEIWKTERL